MTAVHRLDEETRHLLVDADTEVAALLGATLPEEYQRFLARWYGFLAPVERSLADTGGLDRHVDARRLRKHVLLQHDLQTLGMRPTDLDSLPQCMSIPWFEDVHTAIGWLYVVERSTLAHPNLYRHLASVLPGEAAFAASYLKCYSATVGEMWQRFVDELDAAIVGPHHLERVIDGAKAGFRHFRRWRHRLDGKALSGPHPTLAEDL